MLALAISFVALRRVGLYHAQVDTPAVAPVQPQQSAAAGVRVRDLIDPAGRPLTAAPGVPALELLRLAAEGRKQEVLPVLDREQHLVGLLLLGALEEMADDLREVPWVLAGDLMLPPASVGPGDDLQQAARVLLARSLRELPVTDAEGRLLALLGEQQIAAAFAAQAAPAAAPAAGRDH
jgi:CBS domain-containing protein